MIAQLIPPPKKKVEFFLGAYLMKVKLYYPVPVRKSARVALESAATGGKSQRKILMGSAAGGSLWPCKAGYTLHMHVSQSLYMKENARTVYSCPK